MNAAVVTVLLVVLAAMPLGSFLTDAAVRASQAEAAERPPAGRRVVQKALGLCESYRLRPAVVVEVADGEPSACARAAARAVPDREKIYESGRRWRRPPRRPGQ